MATKVTMTTGLVRQFPDGHRVYVAMDETKNKWCTKLAADLEIGEKVAHFYEPKGPTQEVATVEAI